jgi:hypothetical protein
MPTASAHKKKHTLIYAGVAGAVVVLFLVLRKRKASEEEESSPTYASAPSSIPAAGETVADAASQSKNELQEFEKSLSERLEGQVALIASSMQSRTGEQVGSGSSSPSPSVPSAPAPVQSPPAPEGCGYGTKCYIKGMEENAYFNEHSHGSPAPPPPPAPAPPEVVGVTPQPKSGSGSGGGSGYTTVRCGNGCEGHRHSNGQVDCQVKNSKGQCYWP